MSRIPVSDLQRQLSRQTRGLGSGIVGGGFARQQAMQQQAELFSTLAAREMELGIQQANRQQMLNLLGLSRLGQSGGLLGQPVFQGILGSPLGETVGGVSRGLGEGGLFGSPGGGGGELSQPGGPDAPGSGGGLFGELIGARRQFGQEVLGDLSQFGESQRQRLGERFNTLGNTVQARLESRGLGGSNLATEGQIGVAEAEQQAQLDLMDQLLGRQIETKTQLGESLFGDVGRELDRGVQRTGIASNLISSLLGSTLGVL